MNLAEVGEYWARWQPEAVAIATGGVSVTWSRLEDRTRRIAVGLQAIGVRPGDRVGILGANSLHWCELALGTMRAGAAVVPLNVRGTTAELAYLVDNADLAVIAYDSALAGRYEPLAADRPAVVRVALDDAAPADTTMAALRDAGG
ncbi:MAG: fatty-acyl-CoA synthase, partial [Pseudonocardiales bacterium]|nr:fatty-acyl-CoA synthase [Pseudonocardiales bacterium]